MTTEDIKPEKEKVKEPKKASDQRKKSGLKKLDPDTTKLLQSLSEKANKKTYGKKIRDSEILGLGLSLIQPSHLAQLQEQSLTPEDHIDVALAEYQKNHGKISRGEYLVKLLKGEIPPKTHTDSVKA